MLLMTLQMLVKIPFQMLARILLQVMLRIPFQFLVKIFSQAEADYYKDFNDLDLKNMFSKPFGLRMDKEMPDYTATSDPYQDPKPKARTAFARGSCDVVGETSEDMTAAEYTFSPETYHGGKLTSKNASLEVKNAKLKSKRATLKGKTANSEDSYDFTLASTAAVAFVEYTFGHCEPLPGEDPGFAISGGRAGACRPTREPRGLARGAEACCAGALVLRAPAQ